MGNQKVIQIGNSAGVIIPKEVLDQINLSKGDDVSITCDQNGIHITPYDAEFESQLAAGRKIAKKYRNALRALAK